MGFFFWCFVVVVVGLVGWLVFCCCLGFLFLLFGVFVCLVLGFGVFLSVKKKKTRIKWVQIVKPFLSILNWCNKKGQNITAT